MTHVSRRTLIAGASSTPLLAAATPSGATSTIDAALAVCARYLDFERREHVLHRAWARKETWLAKNCNWFNLNNEQRHALREAGELYRIDDAIEALQAEGVKAFEVVLETPATSVAGAIAKLEVVAQVIEPDDYPRAHQLLTDAIAELKQLAGR